MKKVTVPDFLKFVKGNCYRDFDGRSEMLYHFWIVYNALKYYGASENALQDLAGLISGINNLPTGGLVRGMKNNSVWKGGKF